MQGRRVSCRWAACTSQSATARLGQLRSADTRGPAAQLHRCNRPGFAIWSPSRSGWTRRAATPVRKQMSAPPSSGRRHLAPVQFRLVRGRAPAGRLACPGPARHRVRDPSSPGNTGVHRGRRGVLRGSSVCAPARSGWREGPRGGIAIVRKKWRTDPGCSFQRRRLSPHQVRLAPRQTSRIGFFFPVSVNDRFTKRKYTILPAAFAF